jgi:hypothetical protein
MFAGLLFVTCSGKTGPERRRNDGSGGMITGPANQPVKPGGYTALYYVSLETGSNEEGDGSRTRPWKHLGYALERVSPADSSGRNAVLVAAGVYTESPFRMRSRVDLYGGFDPATWSRDIFRYQTVLTGEKRRRVVIGADHARLDGFKVMHGEVRGMGGGILCESVSPRISNNIFYQNRTLGPVPWSPAYWHEMAHDGGAVFCSDGASPVIGNNLFVENATENGRGGAVSLVGESRARIVRNVFLHNSTGLNDPMRSSDGGALSVFDWCAPLIEGNLFIGNRALNHNDGGALFLALWSSGNVVDNRFIDNHSGDDAGALFVGGQEHRYDRPLDPLPDEERFFVTISGNRFIANTNPSMNSGAMRFTMESRGEFINNVLAHNTGVYFQRSEVRVVNNTILDNFLFVETKQGLGPGVIRNNIIWGDFHLETDAVVSHCNMLAPVEGEGIFQEDPVFQKDGLNLEAVSTSYIRKQHYTRVFVSGGRLGDGNLAGRVIQSGGRWSVIRDNSAGTLTVWGDLSRQIHFTVLPTYHLTRRSPCAGRGTPENAPARDMDGESRPVNSGVDVGADQTLFR